MGWSFNCIDYGKDNFIKSITTNHFAEGYTSLEHRIVGNNVWQLVQGPEGKFIHLDMIAKERGGGWGYKGMSEDAGPYQLDCPLSLLSKADPPRDGSYAVAWREKVRAYHAAKRNKPKPVAGLVVQAGSQAYRLDYPIAPRKGWAVTLVETGQQFRMPAAQLSRYLAEAA